MGLFGYAKKVVKHPAYSVATSLVPNLDVSGTLTSLIDKYTGLTPGGVGSDWVNTLLRAGGGYLQGGGKGAAVGALGGLLNNYQPASDWVNNLSNSGALGTLLENAITGGVKATGNAANPWIGAGMGVLQGMFPSIPGQGTVGQNTVATGWNSANPIGSLGSLPSGGSTSTPTGGGGTSAGGSGTGTTGGATSGLSALLASLGKLPVGAQVALGSGALGLLGSLFGGSSSGSGNSGNFNPPDLWGQSNSSSTGPGYNYANYGGNGYAPRAPVSPIPQADYYTYGSRPEQLFFQNRPPVSSSVPGKKRGGALSRMIPGTASGRSDKVPINGSPGEYIMDAESMALLGDGNPAAGARKLDAMRKRLRMHKGKALASGKFSPDAKAPEHYLGAR